MKEGYLGIIKTVKIIAITALVCTVVLFAGLVAESSLSSKVSGALSNFITGKVDSSLNVSDKISENLSTQSVKLSASNGLKYYFIGETLQLTTAFAPADTKDVAVTYSVDKENLATVDQSGLVTFLSSGTVWVSVTLNSNSFVYDKIAFTCIGEDLLSDGNEDRLTVVFANLSGQANNEIYIGQNRNLLLNGGRTQLSSYTPVKVADESIAVVKINKIYAVSAGTTTLTVTIARGDFKKTIEFPFTVIDNGYEPIKSLSFSSDIVLVDDATVTDYHEYLVTEEGRSLSDYDCVVESSDQRVVQIINTGLKPYAPGSCTLTFTSAYNPNVQIQTTAIVLPKEVTALKVFGSDKITPYSEYSYEAVHDTEKYSDFVKWSVVSGGATIDTNGILVAKSFGKVVIRCQSTINEDLYVEKIVRVTLFDTAYGFVRKLMGHMGLHALLGFGITFTLLFLSKSKFVALLSPSLNFLIAVFTEVIQYFAPGRYCSWTDVLTDFGGSVFGFLGAIALTCLVVLVWCLISRKGGKKLLKVIKTVNYTNIFKKSTIIENQILDEVKNQTEPPALSEITAIDES